MPAISDFVQAMWTAAWVPSPFVKQGCPRLHGEEAAFPKTKFGLKTKLVALKDAAGFPVS
jgi:hypothetical protein